MQPRPGPIRFLLLMGTLVFAVPAFALSWSTQTVDNSLETGYYTSLAMDDAGIAHISYYDGRNEDLEYAVWNALLAQWDITTVDSTQDVGSHSSLALDSSGNPHISYYFFDSRELKHAMWNDLGFGFGFWTNEVVDTTYSVGQWTSIALDAGDSPRISYHNATLSDLQYAAWNGASWAVTSVDTNGFVGECSCLALDTSGNPRISYWDRTNNDLKFAAWNSGTSSWDVETVDGQGGVDVGQSCSLALDADNDPYISYYDDTNGDLKLAVWDASLSQWDIQSVDTNGTVGGYTSLALLGENPRISYHDHDNGDLKFASWNAGTSSWSIETVDSDDFVGRYTSLVVDDEGNAYISYQDVTNFHLEYAVGLVPEPSILVLAAAGAVLSRRKRRRTG